MRLPLHSDTKLEHTNVVEQPVSIRHLTYLELIQILIIDNALNFTLK